jgi:hypothetical protein
MDSRLIFRPSHVNPHVTDREAQRDSEDVQALEADAGWIGSKKSRGSEAWDPY